MTDSVNAQKLRTATLIENEAKRKLEKFGVTFFYCLERTHKKLIY